MKLLAISLTGVTVLLVGSQMLCGFWLASKGVTPEGAAFHRNLGIGMGVFTEGAVLILMGMRLTR